MKQMPRHNIFGGFCITRQKILPDTKVVSDTSVVEILFAEQPNKPFNQSSPFFPAGIFTLVKHNDIANGTNGIAMPAKHII